MGIETKHKVIQNNGMSLHSKETVYVPKTYKDTEALKKDTIVTILSESDQMNLLALVVEQIGDAIGLDTPEFTYAKQEFAKIKAVLNNG